METDSACRGCGVNDAEQAARIAKMIEAAKFDEEDCVAAGEYERRLAACSSCRLLSGGHTCLVCGCIVQVRAKLKAKQCPKPEGSLWGMGV